MFALSLILAIVNLLVRTTHAAHVTDQAFVDFASPSCQYTTIWRIVSSSALDFHRVNFAVAEQVNAAVHITLPANATGLSYIGMKQSRDAKYTVCLDCDSVLGYPQTMTVNAHDAVLPSYPVELFNFTNLDPTMQHTLRVVNTFDTLLNKTGQITFAGLLVSMLPHSSDVNSGQQHKTVGGPQEIVTVTAYPPTAAQSDPATLVQATIISTVTIPPSPLPTILAPPDALLSIKHMPNILRPIIGVIASLVFFGLLLAVFALLAYSNRQQPFPWQEMQYDPYPATTSRRESVLVSDPFTIQMSSSTKEMTEVDKASSEYSVGPFDSSAQFDLLI